MAQSITEPKDPGKDPIDESIQQFIKSPELDPKFAELRDKVAQDYQLTTERVQDQRTKRTIINALGKLAAGAIGLASQRGGKVGIAPTFEGLDTTMAADIQAIKDKYKNELADIRDRETKAMQRAEAETTRGFKAAETGLERQHESDMLTKKQTFERIQDIADRKFRQKLETDKRKSEILDQQIAQQLQNQKTAAAQTQEKQKIELQQAEKWATDKTTQKTRDMTDAYAGILAIRHGKDFTKPEIKPTTPDGKPREDQNIRDIALIFKTYGLIEPGGIVREGEQALLRNAESLPARLQNMPRRLLTGETLTDDQREEIEAMAEDLYSAQLSRQEQINSMFKNRADKFDLRYDAIVDSDLFNVSRPSKPDDTKESTQPVEESSEILFDEAGRGPSGLTPEERRKEIQRLRGLQ